MAPFDDRGPPTPPCLSLLSHIDDDLSDVEDEPTELVIPAPVQVHRDTLCDGLPAVLSMVAKNEDDILSQVEDVPRAAKPQQTMAKQEEEEDACSSSDDELNEEDVPRTPPSKERSETKVKAEPSDTQVKTPPNLHEFRSRKAGCENVDKAHVEAVMKRLTEGGRYHNRQKDKWKNRVLRHQAIKKQVDEFSAEPAKLRREQYIVDHNIIPELELDRPKGCVMVCVDMDCYYAQVEALDNPELIGKPHAVTMGMGNHCILATTSYEARARGVKGGIAAFVGKEICPELILIPARLGRYAEISKLIDQVLVKYDPNFCKASVDEAFCDITHLVHGDGDGGGGRTADEIVHEMRQGIKEITGLTASAGCAPCLMIAKIASDMKKPDGQTIVLPNDGGDERKFVMEFIGKLPLIKVPGIGNVSEKLLQDALGLEQVHDMYESRAIISSVFTPFKTRFLLRIALGISCPWTDMYYEKVVRKGIGTNRTFGRETDETKLYEWLTKICAYLEKEVEYAGAVGGQTFTVKLKTGKFESIRKSITLPPGCMLCTKDDFELFARKVLKDNLPGEYRRIGLKLNKITWKKRPAGSIKKYMTKQLDDGEVLDKEVAEEVENNSKTSAQIEQARQRARKFFYEQFTIDDANREVRFQAGGKCEACEAPMGNTSQFKHVHPHHCPVCRARCFKYLPALHRHLDSCACANSQPVNDFKVVKKEERKITGFFKAAKPNPKTNANTKGVKRPRSRCNKSMNLLSKKQRTTGKRIQSSRTHVKKEEVRKQIFVKPEAQCTNGTIGSLVCPVCTTARFDDNVLLNKHVDSCLTFNSTAFKQAINKNTT